VGESNAEVARVLEPRERGCVELPMSVNDSRPNKGPLQDVSTPDRDIPGITDLSTLSAGDHIELDSHATPLVVERVGHTPVALPNGDTARSNCIEASHERADGRTRQFCEQINLAGGSVIEIVDENGSPVRVFGVDDE
jgi:hypothetical protein